MDDSIITCPSCGTQNRVPATGGTGRPVCGSCRSPLPVNALPRQARPDYAPSASTPLAWWHGSHPLHRWAVGVGAFCVLWCLIVLLLWAPGGTGGDFDERAVEQVFSEVLNEHRQDLFNAIHPMGTAKSVTVHDLVVNWRRGAVSATRDDVESVSVTFTLYWEAPVTRNGYTKIYAIYDFDLEGFTHEELVATNGITNEDMGYAAGFMLGMALREAVGW